MIPTQSIFPLNWLRLQKGSGEPASGAYIKEIHHVWTIDWLSNSTSVIPAYHMNDAEEGMPIMPPDFIQGIQYPDTSAARETYRAQLEASASTRYGCRHYVKSGFHRHLPSSCLILDQRVIGDFVLQLSPRDRNGHPETLSFVKVTTTSGYDFLNTSLANANNEYVRLSNTMSGNCRPGETTGDHGHMLGVGMMMGNGDSKLEERVIARDRPQFVSKLANVSRAAARFAEDQFPGLVTSIRAQEQAVGVCPPDYLGGEDGVASCMNVTKNLINSTHYDVNDGSVCFAIWQEKRPNATNGWRFVLPNVLVNYNNKTYNGVAIEVFHGVSICWDGRQIRHGTSYHETNAVDNTTMGYWFSASAKTLKFHLLN